MKVALIISTYNNPSSLELVLISVLNQTVLPFELIVADDGSTNETKKLIKKYKSRFTIPLYHMWHEDRGFRKTVILNKSIVYAKSDYIIQIDGDVILNSKFIQDHLSSAKKMTFSHGSRVLLNIKLTQSLISNKSIFLPKLSFFQYKNFFNSIRIPILYKFQFYNKNLKGTRGCNFSFFKKDFLKVNGYNEDIIGWGKEDSELSARFLNIGLKKQKLKFIAIMYHLFHDSQSRNMLDANKKILEKTITEKLIYCENGCSKYI
ncbi:MAG: glycosyl transferase [Flavobacteriales bacterium]|nr:glycosyl transferase [Flavobacteriales bacterium]|tara:strand:+ start:4644 stop:5429 length:786 start_codon:yes stop_codon:yes gene_type:complete